MEKEKISIVIPVYNVEDYLPECMDSVQGQTYLNLEILLIDDGSTDSSGKMCDRYAASDKRVIVIHKPNGGLSDARNEGLKYITGRYLTFVDSDDILDYDYIEKLYNGIKSKQADIAMCHIETFTQKKPVIGYAKSTLKEYYGINMLRAYLRGKIRPMAWGKLYDKQIYDEIYFPKGKTTEDVYVFAEVLLRCNRLVVISNTNYFYRQRRNSIQFSSATNTDHIIDAHYHNYAVISKRVPVLADLAYDRYLYSFLDALHKNLLCGGPEDKAYQYKIKLRQHWKRMLASNCCSAKRKLALLLSIACGSIYKSIYIAHNKH